MPVLLTLKMILKSGDLVTLERKQIPKYHETLRRILRAITEHISVDFIGLFECRAGLNDYYPSLVVVRSFSGHDSKETIKPFLDYLDNKKLADMKIRRTTYSVGLTSRIRLWKEANITHYFSKFADLEAKVHNYTVLFSTNDMYMAYDQKFQILSPLLYCRQIQLNETEFKENDERLITLLTPRSIILSYYNRVSPSEVRVCADHYISKHHRNTGNKLTYSVFYMYITLLLIL